MSLDVAPPDPDPVLEAALEKDDPGPLVAAVDALLRRGTLASADYYLERAGRKYPNEPRIAVRRLEVQHRWKDWERFEEISAELLKRFPERADLHLITGQALEEQERYCEAIRAYGRAARRDPGDLEPAQRIARIFRARRRPFLARRNLRRALLHHPDAAVLHGTLGYAYIDDGQYPKAVASFRRAVELEPEDSPWLDDLGGALLLSERWREAAATAVKSLKARPNNERAWTAYAVAHRHLGNLADAEKGYRNAVKASKRPTRARGNLGLFLASRRKDDVSLLSEAKTHLHAALLAHPEWHEVETAYESLRAPPG